MSGGQPTQHRLPRVLVAAAASGQGKTTIAVGLMAALARSGLEVSPGKVGPDYIDPGYHALATGRPGRNLDPWLVGEERIPGLVLHAALTPRPADIAVIEGVMGLFDGQLGTDGFASSAHIARLTHSPVVLVLDISSASRTIGATVAGMKAFAPDLDIAGVILNKVGSPRHADEVRRAVEGIGVPVIGALPRDAGVSAPSRHLGLIPAAERPEAAARLDRIAEQVAEYICLDTFGEIARTAPPLAGLPWSPPEAVTGGRPVVAVAGGRAFTFRYAETDEILRGLGCEPVVFDPAVDAQLPPGTRGLYLGGGFPEVHARSLETNTRLLADIRDAVASGMPTVAECAGLLYLCQRVDGHSFVGAVPAEAAMHPRLTLGYREARLASDSILGPAGALVRGHEFHRTRTSPGAGDHPAWSWDGAGEGFVLDPTGSGLASVHASYLHVHWAGCPDLAQGFASAAGAWQPRGDRAGAPVAAAPQHAGTQGVAEPVDPLSHHGDAEVGEGLADFAVNVRLEAPPPWLARVVNAATARLGSYPDRRQAREALARHHRVAPEMVLPTAGAAEAFTLIAAAIEGRALVVHPQFTEPEAALKRAGREVTRHVLAEPFGLDPDGVEAADLIVVGNPTNPTGVLHGAAGLRRLRAGVLVVDEAFMDAVPGEPESLIGGDMNGVLVLRSLTKTWGLAGLRAGYVVGDPALIAALDAQQTPWSVSTPALAVMDALATPSAAAQAAEAAEAFGLWRDHLNHGLRQLGVAAIPSSAPFVLARVGEGVHGALRERGFAVRRADTFPGLDGSYVRIAVRDPHTTDALLRELRAIRKEQNAG
ncbi:MAG: cobyrinate a,c-diamide synthase [Propionibacteriaceae bacterium]|nr:cobyrinate a,c-diamide synthase [Propionibacteriaceae bacterium]